MDPDTTLADDTRTFTSIIDRSRITIVVVLVVAILVGAAATFLPQPVYRTSTKLVVGQGGTLPQGSQAAGSAADTLTHTMADLVKSDVVARQAIEAGDLALTARQLRDRLLVSLKPSSTVLTVSYDGASEELGQRVLEALTVAFADLVSKELGQAVLDRAGASPGTPADPTRLPLSVTTFDPPHSEGRISPKPARNMAVAVAVGLGMGILLALLRDGSLDRRAPAGRLPESVPPGQRKSGLGARP